MDLVSRLKQYLDARQISVTQFADECGIPRPTASQLLAGRNKKVSDEIISKIHQTYPDLSIVWLMFGEGDMATDANIKTSEPQMGNIFEQHSRETIENQSQTKSLAPTGFERKISSEKIETPNSSGFTFPEATETPQPAGKQSESSYTSQFSFTNETNNVKTTSSDPIPTKISETTNNDTKPITVTPGKGKRVTGIVVYYDDSTYESFIPDPTHRHPFMP